MSKKRTGGPKPKPPNQRRSKTMGMVSVSPDELAEIKENHAAAAWSAEAIPDQAGLNFSEWVRRVLSFRSAKPPAPLDSEKIGAQK